MYALPVMMPVPKRPKSALMGVEVGMSITMEELLRRWLEDWQGDEARVSAVHYPGTVTVCVGSVVELLSPGEEENWYLYVTSVGTEADREVSGYFWLTAETIRQESGEDGFRSDKLFPSFERFTAPLSSVLRVVPVLPGFLESDSQEQKTKYYDMFWDTTKQKLRPIFFCKEAPEKLLEFLSHNSVVSGGGGERNLVLFRKEVMRGLLEFCEKWRTRAMHPRRGVKVKVHVDLEHLLSLPFSMLELGYFQEKKSEFKIAYCGNELDEVLGQDWFVVEVKARKVGEDGEILRFRFTGLRLITHNWENQTTLLEFEGLSQYNGGGLLQWSTLANPAQGCCPFVSGLLDFKQQMFALLSNQQMFVVLSNNNFFFALYYPEWI